MLAIFSLKTFWNRIIDIIFAASYFFLLLLILFFSPELIDAQIPASGLKVHLRADNVTISSGSSISQWNDLSGNNNHATQETPAKQPTVINASLNGLPVINFNGSSHYLQLPAATTLGIQNNDYEMFFVARSNSGVVQFLISGEFEHYEIHLNGDAGVRFIPVYIRPTPYYLDLSPSGTFSNGNAHIFSARTSSSGGAVRVDGIDGETTADNITSSDPSIILLGARTYGTDGSSFFNGDIAEVILYNRVLTPSERSDVEQYLASRYNITSGAFPVELTSFTAQAVYNGIELKWETATEVSNYGFEVERQVGSMQSSVGNQNNPQWELVGFVEGNGNSNSPKQYSFLDNLANLEILTQRDPFGQSCNLQYRLKQIDTDGKFENYSVIAEVSFSLSGVHEKQLPADFGLSQNYPNPFNPSTVISFQLPVFSHVTLKVYDVLGNEVATLVNEVKTPGYYQVKFDGIKLSSGVYIYKLTAGNFTSTKKLTLMK